MREDWKRTTLGEAFFTITGGTLAKSSPELYGTFLPFVKPPELCDTEINSAEDGLSESGATVARILPPFSILVSCIGNLGKIGINTVPVTFNQQINAILPNERKAFPRFLFYQALSPDFKDQLIALASGTTVPIVNKSKFNSIEVTLPPLKEQRRIVGILDEAFAGIATAKANAEKNLENARALFESHLNSVFTQRGDGWVEKPLGEICDLQNGYAFKSGDYIKSSNTLNIRMSSIRPGGTFDAEHNQRFLPDSYAKEYSAFLLNDGDLIIAMTDMAGDPKILGIPTLVANHNGRNFLMNQRVGKLFGFAEDVRVRYVRYFLTCPAIRQFYKGKGAGGLQINISKKDVLSAQIPLPSVTTQDRVVDQLDDLSAESRRLESIYKSKLIELEALKKSLLHSAFTGHL